MKVKFASHIDSMTGKSGNVVAVQGRTGPVFRRRVKGRNPKTSAQVSQRSNFSLASKGYKTLSAANVAAWATFAGTLSYKNKLTGQSYTPTAIDVFVGLAAKFKQINPAGTIPVTPPATSFAGDTITLTVLGLSGGMQFTANNPNATNVKTEFLVQRLASANRKPKSKGYRSNGFIAFTSGTLVSGITTTPGTYAVAYRFVNTLTGQETAPVSLGNVVTT